MKIARLKKRSGLSTVAKRALLNGAYMVYRQKALNRPLRYFLKEVTPRIYRPTMRPKRPEQLYLETTNICTANCVFCAYGKQRRHKGVMREDIFRKTLDQYAAMGGLMVAFTPLLGEPLVDGAIIDRISYASRMNAFRHIHMVSNGNLLLKKDNYRNLVDCGLDSISFSIPEFTEEGYRLIFRNGYYRQTLEGLHRLLSYHRQARSRTKVIIAFKARKPLEAIVNDPDYLRLIGPFIDWQTVFYEYTNEFDSWGGAVSGKDLAEGMKLKSHRVRKSPCWRTYELTVLWDGEVRLCPCRINPELPKDELHVGRMTEAPLDVIFEGEKSVSIRESFVKGRPPAMCAGCQLYSPKPFLSQYLSLFLK